MVSYFIPRGRFLIKSASLRHAQQKQQQYQQAKWPMLRQFRQTFSSGGVTGSPGAKRAADSLVPRSAHSLTGKSRDASSSMQKERRSAWLKWTGFLLRWAPVGIFLCGAVEWQMHRQKHEREHREPRTASNFQAKIYCSLPLRIMSRCWGWLAACQVPTTLRPYLYGWYSSAFNVNLDEALYTDYAHYTSLAEFFTRPLRDGVRVIDTKAPLVSPADGKVLHFGTANNSLIEQVKGVNYSIESFLGPPTWALKSPHTDAEYAEAIKEKHDGSTTLFQCVIYLAPGDYHRFHSPAEWVPTRRRHFDGELLSVSPKIATWMPDLFCLNERVLYLGRWEHGFFSYTAVGATNVGSVQIYMDEKLKTNRWVGLNMGTHKRRQLCDEMPLSHQESCSFKRGDLVGQFNMGSTIVLIFEAPNTFKFNIEAGQKILVGQSLGEIA